jgi:hypothetical protein
MATRTNRPRPRTRPLSLAVQDLHLRHRFPGFVAERGNGVWTWRGNLQPRASSPVYRVSIQCKEGRVPVVRVLSPALAPNAPHLYRGGKLCLYWPEEWRWYGDELIAETIVPWTASWLFYYELWLDTGKWLGPSSHAEISPKTELDRAA